MNPNIPQTYENHRSYDYAYIGAIVSLLSAAVLAAALLFNLLPHADLLLKGLVLYILLVNVIVLHKARVYPLMMQDRIISLEMRLRLQKLIPPEEHWQINGLTKNQLIALHYASDEELPGLMLKVLDQRITDRDTIKQMITNWTADYERI